MYVTPIYDDIILHRHFCSEKERNTMLSVEGISDY